MSIFGMIGGLLKKVGGKVWGVVKTVGKKIGGIFKKGNNGQQTANMPSIPDNTSVNSQNYVQQYPQANAPPLDLNRFVTLPTVNTGIDDKTKNMLMIGGAGLAALLLMSMVMKQK